jgi:hypothetical protein
MDIKELILGKRSSDKRLKLVIPLVIGASLSGCAVYTDDAGHPVLGSAFDQDAIKAELARAEKEYGGR